MAGLFNEWPLFLGRAGGAKPLLASRQPKLDVLKDFCVIRLKPNVRREQ
jgi:hypothetical protein